MATFESPKKLFSQNIEWKWWVKNCWSQQGYVVLSALSGLAIAAAIMYLMMGKDIPKDKKMEILEKNKWKIIIASVLSFIVTFAINNLILVFLCKQNFERGVIPFIGYTGLFLGVFPLLNTIISYPIMRLILGKELYEELNPKQ